MKIFLKVNNIGNKQFVPWQNLSKESVLPTEGMWKNIKQTKNKISYDESNNKYVRYEQIKVLKLSH